MARLSKDIIGDQIRPEKKGFIEHKQDVSPSQASSAKQRTEWGEGSFLVANDVIIEQKRCLRQLMIKINYDVKAIILFTPSHQVMVNNKLWLQSAQYAVYTNGEMLTCTKGLTMANISSPVDGSDALGSFKSTTITWLQTSNKQVILQTTFRVYQMIPAIVFEQYFPAGVETTGYNSTNDVISGFPTFDKHNSTLLNYITYRGVWTFCAA